MELTKNYPLRRMKLIQDRSEVLQIENYCHEHPWDERHFDLVLKGCNVEGWVAEEEPDGAVAGFMIYEIHPHKIEIVNISVHPEFRHRGIGRSFVNLVLDRLEIEHVPRLGCLVREVNLDFQLFLRACGIHAVRVVKQAWDSPGEDGYYFSKRIKLDAVE